MSSQNDLMRQQSGESDYEYAQRMEKIRRGTMTPEQRRAECELETRRQAAQREREGLRGEIVEVVPDPHAIAGGSPIFAARVRVSPAGPNGESELLLSQQSVFVTFPVYGEHELMELHANNQSPAGPVRFEGRMKPGMKGRLNWDVVGGPVVRWWLVLDEESSQ